MSSRALRTLLSLWGLYSLPSLLWGAALLLKKEWWLSRRARVGSLVAGSIVLPAIFALALGSVRQALRAVGLAADLSPGSSSGGSSGVGRGGDGDGDDGTGFGSLVQLLKQGLGSEVLDSLPWVGSRWWLQSRDRSSSSSYGGGANKAAVVVVTLNCVTALFFALPLSLEWGCTQVHSLELQLLITAAVSVWADLGWVTRLLQFWVIGVALLKSAVVCWLEGRMRARFREHCRMWREAVGQGAAEEAGAAAAAGPGPAEAASGGAPASEAASGSAEASSVAR
jgi:hypothetical protein